MADTIKSFLPILGFSLVMHIFIPMHNTVGRIKSRYDVHGKAKGTKCLFFRAFFMVKERSMGRCAHIGQA